METCEDQGIWPSWLRRAPSKREIGSSTLPIPSHGVRSGVISFFLSIPISYVNPHLAHRRDGRTIPAAGVATVTLTFNHVPPRLPL